MVGALLMLLDGAGMHPTWYARSVLYAYSVTTDELYYMDYPRHHSSQRADLNQDASVYCQCGMCATTYSPKYDDETQAVTEIRVPALCRQRDAGTRRLIVRF